MFKRINLPNAIINIYEFLKQSSRIPTYLFLALNIKKTTAAFTKKRATSIKEGAKILSESIPVFILL